MYEVFILSMNQKWRSFLQTHDRREAIFFARQTQDTSSHIFNVYKKAKKWKNIPEVKVLCGLKEIQF